MTLARRGSPPEGRPHGVGVGCAARKRIRNGGVLAKGRPSATAKSWKAIKEQVWERSGGRCEVTFNSPHGRGVMPRFGLAPENFEWIGDTLWRCPTAGAHPHHLLSRARGGEDSVRNTLVVCPSCHRWFDEPYSGKRGRLVAERVDFAPFVLCRAVSARDKWEARAPFFAQKQSAGG